MSANRNDTKIPSGLRRRDPKVLARCLTLLENNPSPARKTLQRLWGKRKPALRIGITGPAGSGKSVLINKLIGWYRGQKKTVGVLAVDPSSLSSGGAFLGDRIRMQQHAQDRGVFVRSMANRAKLGGIAPATYDALIAMEIFGFDVLILETIGAGQSDTALKALCDTVLVLSPPDSVDIIQAVKSGLMEIADIFVISKSDLPGSDHAQKVLQEMLGVRRDAAGEAARNRLNRPVEWTAPVIPVSSLKETGIAELAHHIAEHSRHVCSAHLRPEKERQRWQTHARELLLEEMENRLHNMPLSRRAGGKSNPYDMAKKMMG